MARGLGGKTAAELVKEAEELIMAEVRADTANAKEMV